MIPLYGETAIPNELDDKVEVLADLCDDGCTSRRFIVNVFEDISEDFNFEIENLWKGHVGEEGSVNYGLSIGKQSQGNAATSRIDIGYGKIGSGG